MKTTIKTSPKKVLAILRHLQAVGLGDRFHGKSEEEVLHSLKETRERLWQKKLAARS